MAKEGNITLTNMIYGLGAAIVIVGALFKIQHWPYASEILTIGMLVEAGVFTYSAFERMKVDFDWSLVYPELSGRSSKSSGKKESPEGILTKKLDTLLKEAKIDGELVKSLGENIKNLNETASSMDGSAGASQRYTDQMAKATEQMESINSIYKAQLESASRQAEINEANIENATKLKEQMESLASNLSSLNGVYGGMLSAMNKKS
ncbi:MAG: gliding motility protein GldL [Flavobacteriaceae bacterium]|nr:gliding motility protein GldL [Flavobacteriaceae bacterium]|tara:strand:+ start:2820 stop:3437 length:618 start_codon:yes stop_codon:yes gene_type:complete